MATALPGRPPLPGGGVVPDTRTDAGYRRYNVQAVARLELVRTLRDLGTGLEDIRRLLAGDTSLHDLAAAHLALLDRQEGSLRVRRAVLHAIVSQQTPTDQVALMQQLVSLPDDERERLLDDFWREVIDGLELEPALAQRLAANRPVLPDEPTTEQLEAWIELATLVQQSDFRDAVRTHLRTGSTRFVWPVRLDGDDRQRHRVAVPGPAVRLAGRGLGGLCSAP